MVSLADLESTSSHISYGVVAARHLVYSGFVFCAHQIDPWVDLTKPSVADIGGEVR